MVILVIMTILIITMIISAGIQVIAAEGEHKASRALRHAAEVICDSPAALQVIIDVLIWLWSSSSFPLIVVVIIIIVLMDSVVLYI